MTDLRERVLDKIAVTDEGNLYDALKAVVDLHAPIGIEDQKRCEACSVDKNTERRSFMHPVRVLWDAPYPCATVHAIAKALGVEGP